MRIPVKKKWLFAVGAVVLLGSLSGCGSVRYLAQSVGGHLSLLNQAKPVDDWLADPATSEPLRERLQLTQRMRDYAVRELKLPDNASYRRYADLHRSAALWNVVAAPELSLQLKIWCYPVTGCVGYRGYFDQVAADEHGDALRAEGLEVSVYAVPAYSTLGKLPGGFFSDPLLNTFIRWPEGELARLIFHELAHQVAFAKDDTMFNESFATAVERIGGTRWLVEKSTPEARNEYERYDRRRQEFRALTMQARGDLDAIYRSGRSDADKRAAKAARMAMLRSDYAALKAGAWQGYTGYDGWFARANNASLGVLAAYNELVPQFEALFEREGRDFDRFYAEVRRIAALPRDERRATLQAAGATAAAATTTTP